MKPILVITDIDTNTVPNDYQSLVSAGALFRASGDNGNWGIGWAASCVETAFGENTLPQFAYDIGLSKGRTKAGKPKSSAIYEHRDVFRKFGALRDKLQERLPTLTYSHYREMVRVDVPKLTALKLLILANENGWSSNRLIVERNKKLGKPVPPKKLVDADGFILGIDGDTVCVRLSADQRAQLTEGEQVHIRIYELSARAEREAVTP